MEEDGGGGQTEEEEEEEKEGEKQDMKDEKILSEYLIKNFFSRENYPCETLYEQLTCAKLYP